MTPILLQRKLRYRDLARSTQGGRETTMQGQLCSSAALQRPQLARAGSPSSEGFPQGWSPCAVVSLLHHHGHLLRGGDGMVPRWPRRAGPSPQPSPAWREQGMAVVSPGRADPSPCPSPAWRGKGMAMARPGRAGPSPCPSPVWREQGTAMAWPGRAGPSPWPSLQ